MYRKTRWRQGGGAAVGVLVCLGMSAAFAQGWKQDVSNASLPGGPIGGKLGGQDFKVDRAELQGGVLTLRQGQKFFADREIKVFLFLKQNEKPDGKTYHIQPLPFNKQPAGKLPPHVHLSVTPPVKGSLPKTTIYSEKYSMRLQFGKAANGKLPGQIYVCLPDKEKSYAAGSFTADVK